MKKIVLICFFLFAAATAYAQNAAAAPKLCDLETDAAGNYLISSKEDWETLAYYVKNGKDYSGSTFNTANKTFLLTKDIEDISVPLGCQTGSNKTTRKRFAGTFEGDGHTITININSGDGSDTWKFNKGYAAPFAYTKNVKVKNLHVKGTVTAAGQWGSGLIGSGDDSTTVYNCHVSVTLISNYASGNNNNYANHGCVIAIAEKGSYIYNSWFDGEIKANPGKDFKCSGGFIGLNKAETKLAFCLFNPSKCELSEEQLAGSSQFSHNNTSSGNIGSIASSSHDVYFTTVFGDAQAKATKVDPYDAKYYGTTVVAADGNKYFTYIAGNSEKELTATAAEIAGQTRYWTSFYHPELSYELAPGAVAMRLSYDGDLYAIMDGSVIPAGCAAIIMSTSDIVKMRVTQRSFTSLTDNVLVGTSEETTTPTAGTVYILGKDGDELGFVEYTGASIPANKAYIIERKKR